MSTHTAVIRRIGFWAAVLTGVALVGSQFACSQPQSLLAAPGFPHASRAAGSLSASAARESQPAPEVGVGGSAAAFWAPLRSARYEVARRQSLKARPEGSTETRATQ